MRNKYVVYFFNGLEILFWIGFTYWAITYGIPIAWYFIRNLPIGE